MIGFELNHSVDIYMDPSREQEDKLFISRAIEAAIRLALIFIILILCFRIIEPFVIMVIWGVVIAVAIYPIYTKLSAILGNRSKITAVLYALFALSLLIGPAIMIADSLIDTSTYLAKGFKEGTLVIPPPAENVKEWPIIGENVYAFWNQASSNLEDTIKKNIGQLKTLGEAFFSAIAGVSMGVVQFIFSIIISAVFLVNAQNSHLSMLKIARRLTDKVQGQEMVELITATIRSVTQGVLGVALIQAVLAGIGMYFMGIPGWGLWTVCILVLAVAQLPPFIVLLPAILYAFSVSATTPAVVFTVWSVLVGMSDSFLKPLLLGRGMDTPTLVILLGAIGGMMLFGILGLFVGAIMLAIGYELFMNWLNKEENSESIAKD
ncbi:MAG: AI-2E family transporter [Methyloprofundus sp.]|nr:AI-2E family transporter [Methyloprofundus sp.]